MSMRLVTAATAAALLLASSFAVAGNITFTVQNESGATMTALYGGPSSQDDWGGNILSGRIPPGAELVVTISDARACEYDFRYEFSDKESYEDQPAVTYATTRVGELRARAEEYREKLMDEVAEVSESLMERYLEGDPISHDEIVTALKDGTNHGDIFPVTCGVATRNLATNRLLDAIVEDLPSPVKHGSLELPEITLEADDNQPLYAYVFKTRADPFAGRINLFRVYQGVMRHDSHVMNTTSHNKERVGQLLVFSGKESGHADEFGPGDIGAVAKLKETRAGDWLAERDEPISMPQIALPEPVMAFAMEAHGDEDKVYTSLRRLQEEDPTIDLHRDQETGDQIIAGLSQMHVEVIVDRLKERFGAEVILKPPRVPYQETIRGSAKAHGRHKKQTGGRGQFGDCHIEIEPLPDGDGFEFVNAIKGGVIPTGFIPAVEKGVIEALNSGVLAGYPVVDVKVTLHFGSYHEVDSSEQAFKMAAIFGFKEGAKKASPVILEPMMAVEVETPEDYAGNVMGDLSSRRGMVQGMDDMVGGGKIIKAEVPLSEMFGYSTTLRSMSQGRATYPMEFKHYAEAPKNVADEVISARGK